MESNRSWKTESMLLLAAGLLFSISFLSLARLALHRGMSTAAEDSMGIIDALLGMVAFHMAALALVHSFIKSHGLTWSDFLGVTGRRCGRALHLGALSGILALVPALALKWFSVWLASQVEVTPTEQAPIILFHKSTEPHQLIILGISAVLFAPIVEEILFRGVLFTFFLQRGQRLLAWWGTAVFFAVVHFNIITFVPLTLLALLLAWVYQRTASLLAPIAGHMVFNGINFTLLFFQAQLPQS